jgi:hypothetical protein
MQNAKSNLCVLYRRSNIHIEVSRFIQHLWPQTGGTTKKREARELAIRLSGIIKNGSLIIEAFWRTLRTISTMLKFRENSFGSLLDSKTPVCKNMQNPLLNFFGGDLSGLAQENSIVDLDVESEPYKRKRKHSRV